jgi:hypothetical protein
VPVVASSSVFISDSILGMTQRRTKERALIVAEPIEPLIRVLRSQSVILDSDLAKIYGVQTKALNQAVKRNSERFPSDFAFQLTAKEWQSLRSQFVTSKTRGGRQYAPQAFTEHGALMAANVLNSQVAIAMSVYVVRAFVRLKEASAGDRQLARKLEEIERKLTDTQVVHEEAILQLFKQLRKLTNSVSINKSRQIGFRAKTQQR